MKLARLLLIVTLFGLSCSIARADGTDPKVITSGCGGVGEPACDANFLTASDPSELDNVTFTFDSTGSTASVDVVNWTGAVVGDFFLSLASTDSNGDTLSYSCGDATALGAFSCTQLGADNFEFVALPGGSLCSIPLPTTPAGAAEAFAWLNNPPAPCQYGEVFTLQAVDGDPNLANATVGATIFAPEPSSAFLLLIGLGVGAFGLRRRSVSVA